MGLSKSITGRDWVRDNEGGVGGWHQWEGVNAAWHVGSALGRVVPNTLQQHAEGLQFLRACQAGYQD